ncbi:MAG TPA: response regulator [Acidobacteriaceae bacterium]|nr:response regulator [Acidobacteriaceae bacterium]
MATVPIPQARPHVLVVDDDRTFVNTLVSWLNQNGFDARAAHSGRDAIEAALKSPPAFILMDVMMDGIDGVDAAIAICETIPGCHILLLSGHENARNLLRKASARGHHFELLMKPVETSRILEMLRQHGSGAQPEAQ